MIHACYKQANGQLRQATKAEGEPHEALVWLFEQMEAHENEIKGVLDSWTDSEPTGMGRWLKGVYAAAGAEKNLRHQGDRLPTAEVVGWLLR